MSPLWAALRTVVYTAPSYPSHLHRLSWYLFWFSALSLLFTPPRQTLPPSYMHPPCPAIIGSRAGRVIPQPERPITFLPPAAYTSASAATPTHYLPRSIAAHSSPLSAASSFTVWAPQPWRRAGAQRDTSAINPREDRALRLLMTDFGVFSAGTCLCCEQ